MKISLVIQLTLPLFSCVPTGSFNNTEGLVVNTKYGAVKGKLSPNGLTRQFLGVPFAEPPIESRRFQAPIPKAPWEGIRPTQKYYIHLRGIGAFVMGGGNIYGLYDGTPTVSKQNVIVVTFNYRVGVFGFLTTEELKGNYAIQDQRMAMQWVKENIEFFGGDPNQITCYGQSAGAWSIAVMYFFA
ncbi:alpha/beta-hydrolase [Rozella allomycis CSF55]|uniref:Alpha/beta-hydrolase n=1 Tax=Rozella allomycis (strain CSF55) TaxID=988480 RepID=A0A075ASB0_ROZAC|nr:Carboxylesterase, type B domain-containing protein [Rozella allomycis CSF55]RKP19145.1 alpha/beta-hydrolase [Rozella allomycis CSF55]|eukprot:EPZ31571.1 Carboxylesterase, type B domain-containing protein [Rozella allomycis CSF55]